MNRLLDERVAEVLDGLRSLGRKPELVGQAPNLMSSDAFNAVLWVLSMSPLAPSRLMPFPLPRHLALGPLCVDVLLEQN